MGDEGAARLREGGAHVCTGEMQRAQECGDGLHSEVVPRQTRAHMASMCELRMT